MPYCSLLHNAEHSCIVTRKREVRHKRSCLFHVKDGELVISEVLCVLHPASILEEFFQKRLYGAVQNKLAVKGPAASIH